jgi:hypothetical protein
LFTRALPCPNCGCGCECEIIPLIPQVDSSGVTQVSGSWTFVVTYLDEGVQTSSNNAVLLHNTAMPSGMVTQYSEWLCSASGVGDDVRFIFLYASSTDYWYAKIIPGATDGELKLYQVTAGPTHTQRGSTQTVTGIGGQEAVYVQACLNPDNVSVRAMKWGDLPSPPNVAAIDYAASVTIAGTKIGQGTGTVGGICGFYYLVAIKTIFDECGCAVDCFASATGVGDCDTLTECCAAELGTMPATVYLSIASGGLTTCAGSPDTLTSEPLTLQIDDCTDNAYPYDKARRLSYFITSSLASPLCGSNSIDDFAFTCVSCLNGASEIGCSGVSLPSYAYLHAYGIYGGTVSGVDFLRSYAMDITSCDPFYAESADGKLVITE